jgi:hypothetical protein
VLPASLIAALSAAAASPGTSIEWRSQAIDIVGATDSGASPADGSAAAPAGMLASHDDQEPETIDADFESVVDRGIRRVSVAEVVARDDDGGVSARGGRNSHRLLGTLVHRLVRRFGVDAAADIDDAVLHMLHSDEAVDIADDATLCRDASNVYRAMCARADVREMYESGPALHEVPFTMGIDGRIVRGTIDCIIAAPDSMIVLDFKTGRPRPEHQRQVELYGKAVQAMHPGARVDARVIYLGDALN